MPKKNIGQGVFQESTGTIYVETFSHGGIAGISTKDFFIESTYEMPPRSLLCLYAGLLYNDKPTK